MNAHTVTVGNQHVLICAKPLSQEEAENLRDQWEQRTGTPVVVLSHGVDLTLLNPQGHQLYPPTPAPTLNAPLLALTLLGLLLSIAAITLALVILP